MIEDNHDGETGLGFSKVFNKCPVCGSTERFFEGIINELHTSGMLDTKVGHFDFQIQQGVAVPPQKLALLPIGAELPAFNRVMDNCSDCGSMYCVRLDKGKVKKSLNLAPQPVIFNRAERRRMEQSKENFRPNNPFLS